MARVMRHRPDYVGGTISDKDWPAEIGWMAHSDTLGASMPIWSHRRDICIVLAGEIVSPELAIEDSSNGDTKEHPLIALYSRFGAAMIEQLNGWFSGILVDCNLREVLLFNDRYGLSRIYVHETADEFHFSSEAKSILAVLPQARSLDPQGAAEWLTCGCVLQGRTLFRGVELLPPGSLWRAPFGGIVRRGQYFDIRAWEEQDALDPEEYYQRLKERFAGILPRYFRNAGPCGVSLTGGVDSRLIMAWSYESAREAVSYSFSGPIRECQDAKLGRVVANAVGMPHRIIRIQPDFFAQFPDLAAKSALISDGSMDATGAVELYVNAAARELSPVRITGNYGGEILRRMVAFGPRKLDRTAFAPDFRKRFDQAAALFETERSGHPLTFITRKQVPWHHYSRLSIEQSQLTVRSPFLDNDLVALAYRAPKEFATGKSLSLRLIYDGRPELKNIPTDRGLRFHPRPLVDAFRRHWIAFTVKAEYACDYGMPQRAVAVNRLLEPLRPDNIFLGHHKFYHFRSWYRNELAGFVRETLDDSQTLSRDHFDSKGLQRLVKAHVSGKANFTIELNRLLGLELAQRQLFAAR